MSFVSLLGTVTGMISVFDVMAMTELVTLD